jgi:DNA-binding CsgD family transcriptional regulator
MLDFIGQLYDAAADPALWRAAAPGLARLFGSDGATLFTADAAGGGSAILGVTEDVSGRYQRDYEQYYYKLDEWVAGGMRRPGEVLHGHEVAPRDWYRKSELFNEMCVRAGIHGILGSAIPLGGSRFGLVALHCSKAAPEFDAETVRRLESLIPHFRRAMQLTLRLSGAHIDHQAALDGLERTGTAIILVDRDRMILFANGLAENLLRHGGSLRSVSGRLAAVDCKVAQRLATLIHGAATTAGAASRGTAGGAVAIERDDGRAPITMLVTPFRPALPASFGAPVPTALVFVRDPETPTMAKDVLQDLFGFTPTQAAVAARLAGGEELEHIAATMHISLHTVRDHLKVIFAKTGAQRQSQLVALLAPTVAALAAPGNAASAPAGSGGQKRSPALGRASNS